jgi:hypothetical protein
MALAAIDQVADETGFSRRELEPVNPKIGYWRPVPHVPVSNPAEDQNDRITPVTVQAPRLLPPTPDLPRDPKAVFQLIQSWEGVVLWVTDDAFNVRVVDLTGDRPDEEMELEKRELSDFDLELLEPGAIFYWRVGYRMKVPHGARERVSQIRFRRLPAWSRSEIAAAEERAELLARELDW